MADDKEKAQAHKLQQDGGGNLLKAEHLDAFLTSAFEALGNQAEARPERGSPVLRTGDTFSMRELTALVALAGDLTGVIFCSMSLATASKLSSTIMSTVPAEEGSPDGAPIIEFVRMISEAGVSRLQSQCRCVPEEPRLIHGFGEPLTDFSPVLIVPLFTEHGDIDMGISLQPAAAVARPELVRDASDGGNTEGPMVVTAA